MNKTQKLLKKLISIGLDDFTVSSLLYDSINLDWWYDGRDVIIGLSLKKHNDEYYNLKVIFYDVYDEDSEDVVFDMNFLSDDLFNSVEVHNKLCKNLLPNEIFKNARKGNICLVEDFDIAVKIFDKILFLVKDEEIQYKLDSKPTPENPRYTEVKQVLRGELIVDSLKKKLINWISNRFQIEVLHIIYDIIQNGEIYRIIVIVKTREEFESMRNNTDVNYNPIYQKEIENAYKEIYKEENVMNTKLYKRLFVAYDCFYDLYQWSEDSHITEAEMLKKDKTVQFHPSFFENNKPNRSE